MKAPGNPLIPLVFFSIGLTATPVRSDAPYPVLLERFSRDILKSPTAYLKRIERASLILEQGNDEDILRADIDTLLAHSEWRSEGECLKARHLYRQGRLQEAKALIQKNIQGKARVVEQARLLAAIELSGKDTAAAIAAYRTAWDQNKEENDYVELLNLYKGRGKPPEELLSRGLQLYPQSAGAVQMIFEVWFAAGNPASLKKSLEISKHAANTLWPLSVDWKIRQAQALLALKKSKQAETVLLAALDLLDDDARLQGENGEILHKQIFTLLEEARTPP